MATYRNIQMTFWTDSKVSEEFTPNEKLMYLYLMTNPHTNLCGCYEISKKQIAFETGFSSATTGNLIKKLCGHGVIDYSEETNEVLIVNWHKYNWTSSEKLRKALEFSITQIVHRPFRRFLEDLFKGIDAVWDREKYDIDTVSEGYGYNGNGNGNVSFRLGNGNVSVKDTFSLGSNVRPMTPEEEEAFLKEEVFI